jgi:hypothetical protein
MTVEASLRSWTVGAAEACDGFQFKATGERSTEVPASAARSTKSITLVVEVRRQMGGLMPRALVGARFEASPRSTQTMIVVSHSGGTIGPGTTQTGLLGRQLVPGLPEEFVTALTNGLRHAPLPSGTLRVVKAGYDPVESSRYAFEHAGRLLGYLIPRRLQGDPLSRDLLSQAVRSW